MNYSDTKFSVLFNKFGIINIIKSKDCIISFLISVFVVGMAIKFNNPRGIIEQIAPLSITVSSALIAVVIAGLAIVVSISDEDFIKILKKSDSYDKILFLFYYVAALSGTSIIINIIAYIIAKNINHMILYNRSIDTILFILLLWFSTFFAIYSLLSVIFLVGTIMRYGIYRKAFIELNNNR